MKQSIVIAALVLGGCYGTCDRDCENYLGLLYAGLAGVATTIVYDIWKGNKK